jgi:hypothetical protein
VFFLRLAILFSTAGTLRRQKTFAFYDSYAGEKTTVIQVSGIRQNATLFRDSKLAEICRWRFRVFARKSSAKRNFKNVNGVT